jgi:hypothetical protein
VARSDQPASALPLRTGVYLTRSEATGDCAPPWTEARTPFSTTAWPQPSRPPTKPAAKPRAWPPPDLRQKP